jgi:hypothetical protein
MGPCPAYAINIWLAVWLVVLAGTKGQARGSDRMNTQPDNGGDCAGRAAGTGRVYESCPQCDYARLIWWNNLGTPAGVLLVAVQARRPRGGQ